MELEYGKLILGRVYRRDFMMYSDVLYIRESRLHTPNGNSLAATAAETCELLA